MVRVNVEAHQRDVKKPTPPAAEQPFLTGFTGCSGLGDWTDPQSRRRGRGEPLGWAAAVEGAPLSSVATRWKKTAGLFHAMEKGFVTLPRYGKIVSTAWKNRGGSTDKDIVLRPNQKAVKSGCNNKDAETVTACLDSSVNK